MLKRALLPALLTLGLSLPVAASPAIWEVSDSDSKIWLFGSVHILPPDTPWRTPLFDKTLQSAETVYFEADIGPLGMIAMTLKLAGIALHQPATPWTSRLTPDQSKTLLAAITPLGLTVEQLGQNPPWLAEQMIAASALLKNGFKTGTGVDEGLEGELPKERKAYFETASAQLDLLANDSEDVQVSRLIDSLSELDQGAGELKDMVGSWMSGDVDTLASSVAEDPDMADADLRQRLLLGRNANWMPTIESLLRDNHQDLIVVGAAHLAGEGSVIDLLGKAGFSIKRIQ